MKVFGIDPGSEQSAYVIWNGEEILAKGILENGKMVYLLMDYGNAFLTRVVIEQVRSYGMAVGMTVFDTVFWSGRFCQAYPGKFHQVPRLQVKQHICHDSRAKDSNIRRALIDRFEPDLKPRQRPKSILHGVSNDIWAAMALAVTWWDQNSKE